MDVVKTRVVVAVFLAFLTGSAGDARVVDPRSDLAAIKADLEQRLKKLSAARQRELRDVIAAQEQRIRQAEELIGILEELESGLASQGSHLALLKAEWDVAELRSNAAQSRLASAARERDADVTNFESYRQTLWRKWGCPVNVPRCERQFTRDETAASEAFGRDKNDFAAREQALKRKWSRSGELDAAAQQARRAADAKRISHEQARAASDAIRAEIQSRGNELRALGSAIERGWREFDGVAPGPGPRSESPPTTSSGPGGGVRVPNGIDASALLQLVATWKDERARINAQGSREHCYDSNCITTNDAGVVVVPELPQAVESRLANNHGYKAAIERATAAENAFRAAEAEFLRAGRDPSTPPELLQQLDKERTAANVDRMETKIAVGTYFNLTPVPPKPRPKRPEPPSPIDRGGSNR